MADNSGARQSKPGTPQVRRRILAWPGSDLDAPTRDEANDGGAPLFPGPRHQRGPFRSPDAGGYLTIELTDLSADPPDIVPNVRCFERSSQLMVAAHPPVAAERIERLIAITRERLPHWEKNWDRE